MDMRRKWMFAPVIVVLAAMAIAIVLVRRQRPTPPAAVVAAALPAGAGQTFTGTIRPQHVVNFGPTVKGTLESFMVEVGDEISEGQTVARLSAMGLESERENAAQAVEKAQDRVNRAENAVNAARLEESRASAELEKARALFTQVSQSHALAKRRIDAGAIPRNAWEASEKEFQSAQQTFDIMNKAWRAANDNIDVMQQMLDRDKDALAQAVQKVQDVQGDVDALEIRSPVDGWIVARQGQPGQPAEEVGDQMFQVATDLAAMEVVLDVKPDVLKRIYRGMQALVLIPEVMNTALEGTVKSADDKQAVVEFVSPTPNIRPGTKADVRLKLD